MGGIFAGSCCFAARLRDKDDSWNAAVGGAAAGSLFGVRGESSGQVLGEALKCVFCIVPCGEVYELLIHLSNDCWFVYVRGLISYSYCTSVVQLARQSNYY